MADCPNCEYHKSRALRWRDEAYKQAGYPLPEPPPECQTEAEKTAFAFGWFKAMATKRPWVGLTDKEVAEIVIYPMNQTADLVRTIEAKLKAKNGS